MKKDTPLIANIMLDGILPSDLKIPDSDEKGVPVKRVPTYPVEGKLTIGGQPLAGANVAFHRYNTDTEKYVSVCDGRTDANGRFQVTTYSRFDGAPAGDFVITVTKSAKGAAVGPLPDQRYATPTNSPLRVPVRETVRNVMELDLIAR
jgi:hypothetical protein